jgi:hypothetical protein
MAAAVVTPGGMFTMPGVPEALIQTHIATNVNNSNTMLRPMDVFSIDTERLITL